MNRYIYLISPNVDKTHPNSKWVNAGIIDAVKRPKAVIDIWDKHKNNSVFSELLSQPKPFLIKTTNITFGGGGYYCSTNTCLNCGSSYTLIDKINNECTLKGKERFCSRLCEEADAKSKLPYYNLTANIVGINSPCIYKITNKITNLAYIGQTKDFFTTRWKSHFFSNQSPNCKFAEAVKSHSVADWIFEVIEVVNIPSGMVINSEINEVVSGREMYWIEHYNSIENGYNTTNPSKSKGIKLQHFISEAIEEKLERETKTKK